MDLPDKSQWDETTCDLAVCQHPQCWATIRRIERGHPRLLDSSSKSFVDAEDKLPVLTIVNIADSCFPAKRVIRRRHLPGFTFTKAHSLLSSKFDSKFQGRPWKDLPDRDLMNRTDRSPKLSVLNLNETKLPCPQDVGNMDVIWIPEKHVSLLLDKGKTILYPEIRTQLAMMRKKPPLEKSRPDSAISAKMYLSVHRLTLQKPALRYPEHLKKHCSNLKTDGRKTLRGQQSDKKRQQQQMKTRGPPSKQDSTERPQTNVAEKFLDSSRSKKSPELSQIEYTKKDIKTQMEILLEDRMRTPKSASSVSWNPELKLLRILQATDEEDEEIHPSGAQSEVSEV
ncbi:hypothetical protein MG293_007935 [Ovis ammon polii]|uniref:Uncharacterized protein n=1 Tax=Ovis ammon polii TaxID=230172 RepID=A0AAD4UAQ7_OVIAM|nr:hypothetical protein MG293_007935 [Ovis ammon polii]KAI4573868.1 hypothetical protein MJT46_005108 [Ovis ammon polii x Ovis aries]